LTRRMALRYTPALLAAFLINLVIFGLASLLTRERGLPDDLLDSVGINLVNLAIPEPPEPEKVKEPPKPPTQQKPDFAPDLVKPPLLDAGAFDLGAVAIDIDGVQENANLGGDIIFNAYELDQEPQAVVRVPPIYPYRAREQGIEGKVLVQLLVNADGSVGQVIIQDARPKGVFEEAVLRTLPTWKFNPGKVEGVPVTAWVVTTVNFELN